MGSSVEGTRSPFRRTLTETRWNPNRIAPDSMNDTSIISTSMSEQSDAVSSTSFRIPDSLASPRSKLIYLYISVSGGASVSELKEALQEPLLTIYKILSTLLERQLIKRDGERFVPT